MNQIELWFSILVRKLLKRGSFAASVAEPNARLMGFIEHFNCTVATPFRWTYTGKPLAA